MQSQGAKAAHRHEAPPGPRGGARGRRHRRVPRVGPPRGLGGRVNSVCDNSDPTQLRFHLLAPTREEAETLARETETACDGAVVLPYGLAEFETQVRTRVGEEPMWTTALAKVERSQSMYAVPVARWDRDKKHTSPYNHARFYAPQLIEGDTLVMLDDDVIVQGDITTLKPQQKAVAAGCQQWYVNGDGFESSTDLSYADVPYFGYGVLSEDRGDPSCAHEHATECVPGDARRWFAEVARTDQAVARRASWSRLLRRLAAIKDDAFFAAPRQTTATRSSRNYGTLGPGTSGWSDRSSAVETARAHGQVHWMARGQLSP